MPRLELEQFLIAAHRIARMGTSCQLIGNLKPPLRLALVASRRSGSVLCAPGQRALRPGRRSRPRHRLLLQVLRM
jgi:hypothetical protein